jgi:hypothetical protein
MDPPTSLNPIPRPVIETTPLYNQPPTNIPVVPSLTPANQKDDDSLALNNFLQYISQTQILTVIYAIPLLFFWGGHFFVPLKNRKVY